MGGGVRGARGDERPRRVVAAVVVVLLAWVAVAIAPSAALAQPATDTSVTEKEQQLLERYAPVMAIRQQPKECDGDERYRPMRVDYVLGRDDVVLRDADGDVVTRAPTAEDLAGLGPDHWLDFPGDPLNPGCSYEKWFRSFDATPSIYGRVTTDQQQLVVQYWFYWAFNQWNDLHESDWEMIQLQFDTDDLDEALAEGPSLYAYAQHEGAEYALAGDDKVELVDDTHPVVYSSGGSHASYFSSTRWFGKSSSTGFGCDDTTGPTERLRPEVVALPREPPTTGELAWLSYLGHWGQEERFFDDGPTGPAAKDRWDDPLEWVDEKGRETSVALPFAQSGATKTFCGLSASGSALFNRLLDDPVVVVALVLVVIVGLVVVVRFGSRGLLGRGARTWWGHRRAFLRVAAVTFAGGLLVWLAQLAVVELTVVGRVVDVVGESSAWALPLVTVTGAVVAVPFMAWMVAASTRLADPGDEAGGAGWALRLPGGLRSPVLHTGLVVVAVIGATLFVLPPLVILAALWLPAPAVSHAEGSGARASLRRSRRLLRGHRWRALALTVTLGLVLAFSGLVGALVLLVTSVGFGVAGLVVAAVNALLLPYAAVVAAHFYEEVVAGSPRERVPVDG